MAVRCCDVIGGSAPTPVITRGRENEYMRVQHIKIDTRKYCECDGAPLGFIDFVSVATYKKPKTKFHCAHCSHTALNCFWMVQHHPKAVPQPEQESAHK